MHPESRKLMNLQTKITEALKESMKLKDTSRLEALRAIKSAILLANTESANASLTEADEIKLLQRLVKQRRESAAIYQGQNRQDLADVENMQADVIAGFLPKQLSSEEVAEVIKKIVADLGVSSVKEMGKVMAEANQALAGKADGKLIATLVKEILS